MAGLGKYKKGASFTLKSGNKPTFVQMGSSPAKITGVGASITGANTKKFTPNIDHITKKDEREDSPANLNNFGVGQGGSPYKSSDDETEVDPNAPVVDPKVTTDKESKVNEQGGDAETADPGWKKALKIGTTLLSGGIQGVYGGKREVPKINYGKKAEEVTKDPVDGVKDSLVNKSAAVEYDQDGKKIFPDDPRHSANSKTTINNENSIVDGKETSKTT